MENTMICVSGGFDPIHPGHISLFEEAASYGPLTVILNSDTWLIEKKGYRVMKWEDRASILHAIHWVSDVQPVEDRDKTVCEALRRIKPKYFAKSGDRGPASMPQAEIDTCRELGIEILYGICPHLPYSSSSIIAHARKSDIETEWRKWGMFEVYDQKTYPDSLGWKVKRLEVAPGQRTSLQYHNERTEHLVVVRGRAKIEVGNECGTLATIIGLPGSYIPIRQKAWHRITNPDTALPLVIVEVQTGRECSEVDIVRFGDVPPLVHDVSMIHLSPNLSDA